MRFSKSDNFYELDPTLLAEYTISSTIDEVPTQKITIYSNLPAIYLLNNYTLYCLLHILSHLSLKMEFWKFQYPLYTWEIGTKKVKQPV